MLDGLFEGVGLVGSFFTSGLVVNNNGPRFVVWRSHNYQIWSMNVNIAYNLW